ncbi:MAG TPA: substrate-binding domain-containing protein, partial [Chryseolinea sp.]
MKIARLILLAATLNLATVTWAQRIGLLMDSYVIDRWYIDQKLFTDKIKELGGECIVEMPYGDPDEQVKLGKKLISEKIDVLVIIPSDRVKAAAIVQAAKEANIPVIAYDRMIDTNDLTLYVSYNNLNVGKLQAQYATNKMPQGNYLLINGPESDMNAISFREGQRAALKSYIQSGKIKIIGDYVLGSWSELESLMKTDEFLTSHPEKPDVIIAANDALATGAIQSLPKDLLGKVIVTGQDADKTSLKNIIAGTQTMTIYKPIRALAYQAAESAMKIAKGEKFLSVKTNVGSYNVSAILLDPVVVDKNNYKETVVKDGHVN